MRTYDESIFAERGLSRSWVQENSSLSREVGTIRGLHFQHPPHAETKLVRAASGRVLDVIVDLRPSSPTYQNWSSVMLDGTNAIFVPRGFAHGFCVVEAPALVVYKVDSSYAPTAEGGLRWNDPDVGVDAWPTDSPILSEKDAALPFLHDLVVPFE